MRSLMTYEFYVPLPAPLSTDRLMPYALKFARKLLESFESNNDFDLSELGINRHRHLQQNSNADIPAAYSSIRAISYNSGLPVYGNSFRATSAYPGLYGNSFRAASAYPGLYGNNLRTTSAYPGSNDATYGLYGSRFVVAPVYPAMYGSSSS